MNTLTDLEAAALGCIWQNGGCTAYALRSHFRASPSARFSDSAGSVYPMATRLARRRLLRTRREKQGRRVATLYECTQEGLQALRHWLAVPRESSKLVTWDPLRTRILYLGLLTPSQRLHWLDEADAALADHWKEIRAREHASEPRSPWSRLADRNTLLQATARRRWLVEVRKSIAGESR